MPLAYAPGLKRNRPIIGDGGRRGDGRSRLLLLLGLLLLGGLLLLRRRLLLVAGLFLAAAFFGGRAAPSPTLDDAVRAGRDERRGVDPAGHEPADEQADDEVLQRRSVHRSLRDRIGVGGHRAQRALNVPSRCQKPVKPLNGPPTTLLRHSRTKRLVFELYVPGRRRAVAVGLRRALVEVLLVPLGRPAGDVDGELAVADARRRHRRRWRCGPAAS